MTAVAVLENGRSLGGKKLLFDAQIFLPGNESLLAALYFFNARDLTFETVGSYFIHASVSAFRSQISFSMC